MKTIIVLLATAFSFSANALESNYGVLSLSGGEYHCAWTNTGGAKDLKYVVYNMERRAGKEREVVVQQRFDAAVAAGETITAHSGISGAFIGDYCRFLSK